jgi:isopenicillin-N N-acyltransferase like protein
MQRSIPILLSLLLVLIALQTLSAAEPFRFAAARHGTGELKYLQGLPVLSVSGTPEEIGAAAGVLAVRPGKRVLEYPLDLLRKHKAGALWALFTQSGNGMVHSFPAAYRTELEAMVKAAKVERDGVVVGNTFFDLKKLFACSALLLESERSGTGGPILARNLDYPSLGYINNYSLVIVYRPKGKRAFVSVGFPGLIGSLSGMNDAGLALAVLEVYDVKDGEKSFDPQGVPYAVWNRKILEECSSIAEAKKMLEGLKRTTTLNLVMADRKGVAVLEVTPGHVVQRNAKEGVEACTNHYCTAPLKPAEPMNVNESFERFETLEQLRPGKGRRTLEDVRKQLDAVNLGELTLQTMAFEPATLKLHLAIGAVPSSQQPFKTLDLGPLFKGQR